MSNTYDQYLTEEDKLHIGVIQYLAHAYPKAIYHHSPNEGKRTPFERYKVKKLGLKKGFPDLIIIHNGVTLALELKTIKGSGTYEQYEWLNALYKNGWKSGMAFGFDEATDIIDNCFKK